MEKSFTIQDHPTNPCPNEILILASKKMRFFFFFPFFWEHRLDMDHLVSIDAFRWLTFRFLFKTQ